MLTGTSVIILNYTKYTDSSIIVHGISEQFGRISFLVYGISSKNRAKLASFQPLYLIDAQLYHKTNRSIQKIKEFKLSPPLHTLTTDIRKSTLALFIAELLLKTIKEEHSDKFLFEFIKTSILFLEELNEHLSVFHLVFLLKLSRFLGFAPDNNSKIGNFYDFKEGIMVDVKPHHPHYLIQSEYSLLMELFNAELNQLQNININKKQRDDLLEAILKMYEIHILNFTSLNSYQVLKEVFE